MAPNRRPKHANSYPTTSGQEESPIVTLPTRLASLMQRVPSETLAGMPKTPQRSRHGVFGLSSVNRSRVGTHHPSG